MKIRTISRTEEDFHRKNKFDIAKVHRNRDPVIHPFERARELTKAVTATKLDKIFAKPFIGALDGHKDGVHCMSTIRSNLVPFISGSCDGELKVWDLSTKKNVWSTIAHIGFVRGISPNVTGNSFFTCGDDKTIKHWTIDLIESSPEDSIEPINVIQANSSLSGIDHHWTDPQFATCGDVISVWDETRALPIHTYKWGADSILSLQYNPAESTLIGSTGNDRGVCLYDLRASVPMRKFVLPMNSNNIVWNPREPMNFALANEDYNVYMFDMRNLAKPLMIHKDHVAAVMDVAFSPTGREFVTGSYDKTVRVFDIYSGKSREVYHTKRMQRVFCVNFSADAKYVLSGSDDTNIRIWKADASKSLGVDSGRAERKKLYLDSLKNRFKHMPEVKRMVNDKMLPKSIKKAKSMMHIQKVSTHRKQENRIKHNKEGAIVNLPEREKVVVKEFS